MATGASLRIRSERAVTGGRRLELELVDDEPVPAVLLLPAWRRPAPAALLLHGYSSRKELMADTLGIALLEREIASLAIDLPLHGERHDTMQQQSLRDPLALARQWRLAQREARLALRVLGGLPEIAGAPLALVGYSMGAFLGVTVAADDQRVRAVVLAAGGDLPRPTPLERVVRAVVDPVRAVRALAGRPLLMVHGRHDRTIRPEQAERLYAAAGEPKELRWWDAGHYLPQAVIADAADWLAERLRDDTGARERAASGRREG